MIEFTTPKGYQGNYEKEGLYWRVVVERPNEGLARVLTFTDEAFQEEEGRMELIELTVDRVALMEEETRLAQKKLEFEQELERVTAKKFKTELLNRLGDQIWHK